MVENAACAEVAHRLFMACLLVRQGVLGFLIDKRKRLMETDSVSLKFQIVKPKAICEAMNLQPGQRLQATRYGTRMEMLSLRSLSEARGLLAGIDSRVAREGDRS